MQSFPVIIALETSPSPTLSSRANALHKVLHSKHTSLLNTRYTISARASFDYQRRLGSGVVQGRHVIETFLLQAELSSGYSMQPTPVSLLQRWYSLVCEKRASRQDFLKALVKVFETTIEVDLSKVCALYMQ